MTTDSITSCMSTIGSIFNTTIGWISDNAILMTFLVAGLVPCGIKIFKKLKSAVK